MPPFNEHAGLDWDSLPPLSASTPQPGSLIEQLAQLQSDTKLYCLALVDDEGQVVREASEEDLERLGHQLAQLPEASHARKDLQAAPPIAQPTFQQLLAQQAKNGGTRCMHCHAT